MIQWRSCLIGDGRTRGGGGAAQRGVLPLTVTLKGRAGCEVTGGHLGHNAASHTETFSITNCIFSLALSRNFGCTCSCWSTEDTVSVHHEPHFYHHVAVPCLVVHILMSLVLKGILSADLSILQRPSLLSAVCLYLRLVVLWIMCQKSQWCFGVFFQIGRNCFCHIFATR